MRQERKTVTMKRKRPPAVNEGLLNYVPPRTPWVTQLATSAYAISGSPFQRALLETADVRLETKAGQSIEPCISPRMHAASQTCARPSDTRDHTERLPIPLDDPE